MEFTEPLWKTLEHELYTVQYMYTVLHSETSIRQYIYTVINTDRAVLSEAKLYMQEINVFENRIF